MEDMNIRLDELLQKQKDYFRTGETRDIEFRISKLKRLKKAIKIYEQKILDALRKDLGKPEQESFFSEVGGIYASIDLFVKNLVKWAKARAVNTPMVQYGESYIEYEPYGSVLIIVPFNYPFQLAMEPLIGAIASGNTAVVKPSELAPETEKVITDIIRDAFDENYVASVCGGVDLITKLLSQRFDYIFFTGSVRVGKIVMEAASKNLTPVTLELGGKSPVFVDENFDVRLAAKRIAWGKFLNNGQTCIAPDYVLVHESRKLALIEELKAVIHEHYGENIKENPDYGRIINEKQTERLAKILESDKDLVVFGGDFDVEKRYIAPAILDLGKLGDASVSDSAAMADEIFGPILPIVSYESLDEAVDRVRYGEKPLAMYIFSKNKEYTESVKSRISSGNITINDTVKHVSIDSLPFGGVGHSGMGSYHGKYSIETFSHRRGVYRNKARFNIKQIAPPYNEKAFEFLRKLFK
ncbi:aldehyde dehydrogenase [Eubacterium sulci ATCC 35585]|nr:aldehyde dehydrogenase [Eubacterium sulci ATCC 35585]EUC77502.1 aldehyde dehydrogenase (NAD) family protein [Eubacterium sulci ATCC 35585]